MITKQEADKLRANIIRELKKNHPKGFCYICGKGTKTTQHHLKNRKEIPLCRPCHNEVEEAKLYVKLMKNRKKAYKEGKKDMLKRLLIPKYKQLYNANTILLLNRLKENISS